MAAIGIEPVKLSNCVVQIVTTSPAKSDTYEGHVSAIEMVPTVPVSQWKGMGGNVVPLAGIPTWMVNITMAQDYKTAAALSKYLLENRGVAIDITFRPVAGGVGYKITALAIPGSIGGALDADAVTSVSLPAAGQPAAVAAA
jgi:predicted membrane GTPase involved in stress response